MVGVDRGREFEWELTEYPYQYSHSHIHIHSRRHCHNPGNHDVTTATTAATVNHTNPSIPNPTPVIHHSPSKGAPRRKMNVVVNGITLVLMDATMHAVSYGLQDP